MSQRPAFHGDHLVTVTMPAKEWDVVLSALETESVHTLRCMERENDKEPSAWLAAINVAIDKILASLS